MRIQPPAYPYDPKGLRYQDYSLSTEQRDIRETFRQFFTEQSPIELVRAAEPLGFDPTLWLEAVALGVPAMRLEESNGGLGLSIVDLTLITEEAGLAAAPIPIAEVAVAAPLAAHCDDPAASNRIDAIVDGRYLPTVALWDVRDRTAQLVPAGAIVNGVVALDGDELALYEPATSLPHAANLGASPLAWWKPTTTDRRVVIATGDDARTLHTNAVAEWRLLTAATLVGIGKAAVSLAVEFAKTRIVSETPIGALQGVSHPLADAEILLVSARHLTWKAGWFHDHEPDFRPELAAMAFVHADESATFAVSTALHVHGGFGFTHESNVSVYFRRAKGWSVIGDPSGALRAVGDALEEAALPRETTVAGGL